MPPQARKAPQDHKPKTTTGDFTFTGSDGKTYALPHPREAEHLVTTGMIRKARRGDEAANVDLIFTVLEGAADAETIAALDELPASKGGEILGDWFRSVTGGVSLGE